MPPRLSGPTASGRAAPRGTRARARTGIAASGPVLSVASRPTGSSRRRRSAIWSDPGRGRVEPLHVVERDEHRPALGQRDAARRARPARSRAHPEPRRRARRAAARPRAPGAAAAAARARPRRRRAPAAPRARRRTARPRPRRRGRPGRGRIALGLGDARLPEDRLADARPRPRARGRGTALDRGEERLDAVELLLAPDQGGRGHACVSIVTCSGRRRASAGARCG